MRPLALAVLALAALAACSADPNGLGEQAVDPPFPLPGQCQSFGVVIDDDGTPGQPSVDEAITTTVHSGATEGHLTPGQADVIARVLAEAQDGPTPTGAGQLTSTQPGYTATATVEDAPTGTYRVGSLGVECT
jgi:hypothetical protein